ncbi:MAG TPA: hypothetical protein VF092_00775 [Longimicrobium sp.]
MKKLRLNLDLLSVQTFETSQATHARGTVQGHLPRTDPEVCPYTRNWYCTYGYECTAYPEYCLAQPTAEQCINTYSCPGGSTCTG